MVSAGDTLQSIALAVFGDARLWYLIADANGLSNDQDLVAGRNLTIPNKITNLHNDYKTFKPYSAGNIIGDTTPTLPDPPPPPPVGGDDGCGGLGAILVIIVVVVVAAVTQQYYLMSVTNTTTAVAATAAATTSQVAASLVVGAMVGNVAGQMVGIAAGIQDEFSWEAVAVSGITAGITQGLGLNAPGLKGLELVQQAAAKSIISQGVNIALGQQDGFSWKAVAVAAIAAPIADTVGKAVGRAIGGALGEAIESGVMAEARPFAQDFGARLASGVVTQVVSQVVYGGGKLNWAQVAGDAFGNAIAESIKNSLLSNSGQQGVGALAEAEAQAEPSGRGLTMPRNFSLTPDLDKIANEVTMEVALQSASDESHPPSPTQADILRKQEEGLTWGSHTVGKEGRRGLWGVAEMIAGPGASDVTIDNIKDKLIAQNPAIGNWNLREGMTVNWDLSGPVDARRSAALDANYQAVMAQRATAEAMAEQSQSAGVNELRASPMQESAAITAANQSDKSGRAFKLAYGFELNNGSISLSNPFQMLDASRDGAAFADAWSKYNNSLRINDTARLGVVSIRGNELVRGDYQLLGPKGGAITTLRETDKRVLDAVGKDGWRGSNLKIGGTVAGLGIAVANDVYEYNIGKTDGYQFAGNATSSTIGFGVGAVAGGLAVFFSPVTVPVVVIAGAGIGAGVFGGWAYDYFAGEDVKVKAANLYRRYF